MQTQGSLREENLASLLQTMQSERATGTLSLENGDANCSLFFLFGHLFHASSATSQGEEVVIDALSWDDGAFKFDPRAKLPAEETIKSSPADLIAQVAPRTASPVAAENSTAGAETTSWSTPDLAASADEPAASEATSTWSTRSAEAVDPTPAASASLNDEAATDDHIDAAAPDWAGDTAPASSTWDTPPTEEPAAWAATPDATEDAPAAEAESTATADLSEGTDEAEAPATSTWSTPSSTPAWEPPPATPAWEPPAATSSWSAAPPEATSSWEVPDSTSSPAPVEQASMSAAEPALQAAPAGAAAATPLRMYPLPSGKALYEGLKSAFVDFPKLLRTLRSDTLTGYVRLQEESYTGTLVIKDGLVLEALSDDSGVLQGVSGFVNFRRHMEEGNGLLDVVELDGETVVALSHLFTGQPLYTGLLGRFVQFDALLDYLAEEKVDGSVVVTEASQMGVILLQGGAILGAYTEDAGEITTKSDPVATLAGEISASIEVKTGSGDVTPIDIDAALAQPY